MGKVIVIKKVGKVIDIEKVGKVSVIEGHQTMEQLHEASQGNTKKHKNIIEEKSWLLTPHLEREG